VSTVVVHRCLRHPKADVGWVEVVNAADNRWNSKPVDECWAREGAVVHPHFGCWQVTVELVETLGFNELVVVRCTKRSDAWVEGCATDDVGWV
jgi:hypothetical protein